MMLLELILLSVLGAFTYADDSIQDVVNIKPGQEMVYEKELNGYTCRFSYQAQGGTNEQWQASIEFMDDGASILCTVERGQTSYLYFQKFKMTLLGPQVNLQQVEAISTGSTPLQPEEYIMDQETSTLSHVEGKFKNHLERVRVFATIGGKTEL